jgi:hypothetical protein
VAAAEAIKTAGKRRRREAAQSADGGEMGGAAEV